MNTNKGTIEQNILLMVSENDIELENDIKTLKEKKKAKDKVDEINNLESWEIYELYKKDNKIKNKLTNERLVKMIQEGVEEMWDVLYKKTEKAIHNVYHKKVHDYYKSTMEEDVYSALHYGWTNSVLTYNEEKATRISCSKIL